MKRWLVPCLSLLVAGCAGPGGDEHVVADRLDVEAAGGSPMEKTGEFVLHNLGANACAGPVSPEVANDVDWVSIRIDHDSNDTRVHAVFEWKPVNPTAEALQFRLMADDGIDAEVLQAWSGGSPQVLLLEGRELAAHPDPFWVQVSATGCAPESMVGVHAVPAGVQEQGVEYAVHWNGADLD